MILGTSVHEVLHAKQRRTILDQVLEKVVYVHEQQLNCLLVQRGKGQHRAEFYKQTQQVHRPINSGHRFVRILLQNFRVLGPFEFVEQLRAQRHIKVLHESGGHLQNLWLFLRRHRLARLLVLVKRKENLTKLPVKILDNCLVPAHSCR